MKDANCGYCMRGELLDKFGIFICDLEVSSLILFKEQSKPGRVIVAYKDHVSEIVNISDEERNAFMADVTRAAKALHAAFKPNKVKKKKGKQNEDTQEWFYARRASCCYRHSRYPYGRALPCDFVGDVQR